MSRFITGAFVAAALVLALATGAGASGSKVKDLTAPTAPTNLRITSASTTSVGLAWDASRDNVKVSRYLVYANRNLVTSTRTTTATVKYLMCGTSYTFGVVAMDAAGNRSGTASLIGSTAPCAVPKSTSDTQAPSTPSGPALSGATTSSISMSWTASSDNVGVTSYSVYVNGSPADSTTSTSYAYTGLQCGTSYTFGVAAFDAAGNRSGVASVAGSTAACSGGGGSPSTATDTQAPTTPSGLALSGATASSVSLGWTAATDNVGVTAYGLYLDGASVGSATSTSYSFTGLTCGTTHTLAVDAVDAAGNRSAKASLSASTAACPDTSAPTAPVFLLGSGATASTISVSWLASADNVGVTGYGVYQNGTKVGTVTGPLLAYTYTGLQCGISYQLGVDAFDAAGNVSPRSTVSVSTTACADTTAPTAPSSLNVSGVSQTGLTLNWTASTDAVGVTSYTVFRNGSQAGTTTTTSYALTGLSCGTSYTLAVEARDAAGNVSSRPSISGTTSACPLTTTTTTTTTTTSTPPPSTTPVTFGETSVTTVPDGNNGGLILAQSAKLSTAGTLLSLSFYVTNPGGGALEYAVYDSTGANGGPGKLLATTADAAAVSGWNTLNVKTPVDLAAGTYWLTYETTTSNMTFPKTTDSSSSNAYALQSFGSFPATFPTPPSTDPSHWSFYATVNVPDTGGTTTTTTAAPATTTTTTTTTSTTPTSPPPAPSGDMTFSCYGANPSCYTSLPCTTTISSGLSTAIANASGGDVICLSQNGSPYPDLTTSAVKSSDVTVQPVPGATVSIGKITVAGGSHLVFTGLTSTGGAFPQGATHTHFTNITFTAPSQACTSNPCGSGVVGNADVTFDHDSFDNIQNGIDEARLRFYGQNGNTTASGFTVSNSHFGGTGLNGGWAGCADGIGMVADVSGVRIGPGDEFDHLQQGNCVSINGAHVDPIQSYIAGPGTTVTGDYFHDNGDGSGGLGWFSGASGTITISNNVFACTGIYPFPVAIPGTPGAIVTHNVITGGCKLEMGKDNQCDDSSGMVVRDNVWVGGGIYVGNLAGCSPGPSGSYTASNDLNCNCTGTNNATGTPVFVGGTNPTSYAGYKLASGSPGKGSASDGTDMGITG